MTRVLATQEGDWVVAKVEGPRSLRSALRQSIPAPQIEHAPDAQVWRIHHGAWPTACTVFSRFEVPIVWASSSEVGVPHASLGLPVSPVSDIDSAAQRSGLGPLLTPASPPEAQPSMSSATSPITVPSPAHSRANAQASEHVERDGTAMVTPAADQSAEPEGERPSFGTPMSAVAEAILQAMAPAPTVSRMENPVTNEVLASGVGALVPADPRAVASSHGSEGHMQDGLKEFTITISGNGLTVERSIDHQTAWAILARLFGPDAAPTDGKVAATTFR